MAVSQANWRRGKRKWPKRVNTNLENGVRHGFRSGLEETNARFLEAQGVEVIFEELKIPYTVPLTNRKYTPDFLLPNGIIIETKGKLEPKDRAKHLFIQLQHPALDIRFVFQRPYDKIRKGSKTTYAAWAEKHGFKWGVKVIPTQWIEEIGPIMKPEEVLGL